MSSIRPTSGPWARIVRLLTWGDERKPHSSCRQLADLDLGTWLCGAAVQAQTELVIADASDDLMQEIESFISRSNAKLIERRKSTTTLERLFLESTGGNDKSSTRE